MSSSKSIDSSIVSTNYAAVLCKLVDKWGVSAQQLLAGSGISSTLLENVDGFLDYDQYQGLIRRALLLTDEPALGLYFGQRLNISNHGLLGYAIMGSATLEQAAQLGMKYMAIRHRMIKLDYDIKDSIAELRFSADIDEAWLYRFEIDAALSSLYCIWKFILGEDAPVRSLAFRYPKPENTEVYQHFFDRDIHFDQNSNHMCFPLAAFQQNSMATDPTLIKITEQQCEQLLGSLRDEQGPCKEHSPALDTTQTGKNEPEDLPEIIRTMLLKTPENFLSQQSVAEQLHMTPRTLARKLKKADSSYQMILDAVRKDLALQYLQATPWSIDEIADMLNYSDPSNFGRAFKRWMGVSPSQYREEQY